MQVSIHCEPGMISTIHFEVKNHCITLIVSFFVFMCINCCPKNSKKFTSCFKKSTISGPAKCVCLCVCCVGFTGHSIHVFVHFFCSCSCSGCFHRERKRMKTFRKFFYLSIWHKEYTVGKGRSLSQTPTELKEKEKKVNKLCVYVCLFAYVSGQIAEQIPDTKVSSLSQNFIVLTLPRLIGLLLFGAANFHSLLLCLHSTSSEDTH